MLHVTSWYPHPGNPLEAIWIKRLVDSMDQESRVYHIAVVPGRAHIQCNKIDNVTHRIWTLPTKRWWVIEIVNFLMLFYFLAICRIQKNFDVINFHIAYPQLVYWNILKLFVGKPVVISEHWSAYHFNFGVSKVLPRIQRIFRFGLPVITVSQSLATDLRNFSGIQGIETHCIPNVVDMSVYKATNESALNGVSFFMVSQWKWPKQPQVVISAFEKFVRRPGREHYKLRIGGYGPQLSEMKSLVNSIALADSVVFLGALDAPAIAREMNSSVAFLHCSEYETFSVVCAEALSCGTPVVASKVGGIPEYLNESNGVLVEQDDLNDWVEAMENVLVAEFDRVRIEREAHAKFSPEVIRPLYLKALKTVCDNTR